MAHLPREAAKMLMDRAKLASSNSYSPYSQFPVGAAVLTVSGKIFVGANVENASFGLTICAERVAISNAVAAGDEELSAIAIYAPLETITPCGACRQFIIEFGEDIIVLFLYKGEIIQKTARELLPYSFSLYHATRYVPGDRSEQQP